MIVDARVYSIYFHKRTDGLCLLARDARRERQDVTTSAHVLQNIYIIIMISLPRVPEEILFPKDTNDHQLQCIWPPPDRIHDSSGSEVIVMSSLVFLGGTAGGAEIACPAPFPSHN